MIGKKLFKSVKKSLFDGILPEKSTPKNTNLKTISTQNVESDEITLQFGVLGNDMTIINDF